MAKPKQDKKVIIPQELLFDLLTISEVRMLKNRFQIVKLIEEGLSVRLIAQQVGVGTDTVVRVTRMTEKNHIKLTKKKTTKTAWVFGKSDS